MSDTDSPAEAQSTETEPTETAPAEAELTARTSFRPTSPLQRETDRASRPGFRDPPNTRTKAHNKKKRK